MAHKLSVEETKKFIGKRTEYALVDVREQEEFSQQHQLLSCCIPYSRIEFYLEQLVPCKKTPIILTDSGTHTFMRSERAALIVEALGYSAIYIQDGGIKAWVDAGYETFEGVNVLSKAFGELVAEECHTPLTTPDELDSMLKAGKDVTILDVRPYGEFNNMCIPNGKNTPGSELLYRLFDQVPNPNTHILVNCAGRTRGLIGTQSLINAKVPNPVTALKGGTMGWELASFPLQYGQTRYTDFPSNEAIKLACERAAKVAKKVGVKYINLETMKQWESENKDKTLYLFDVRQLQEYEAGHYPNSRHAEGGQLVQATDEYAAVRCARYVIMDDTGARANTAASWLTQMGYPEVYVLKGGIPKETMITQTPETNHAGISSELSIKAATLREIHTSKDVLVIDVGISSSYKTAHIPHSVWVPRSRIALAKQTDPVYNTIVIVSDDVVHAQNTLADARLVWPNAHVVMLSGGRQSWLLSNYPTATGLDNALCEADDIWYKPYEDTEADPADMQGYFDWEYGLVEKINRDGDAHFKLVTM
ncbi:MAG: Rhodanese-related sulfurtransferase [uncultured Thiotrichaceae bacterium]|uniref:Rhodanese-related sulfurtransferase n=1 Tax=uncultured Thiotrichaceae bacterium TaxID=298394 RepID=A0A6S6TTI3_9GAMM|nr:MAG: Rhodanese-related sulfurtransferase [uncultured Thiotrichaceae bacterium]